MPFVASPARQLLHCSSRHAAVASPTRCCLQQNLHRLLDNLAVENDAIAQCFRLTSLTLIAVSFNHSISRILAWPLQRW